MRMEYNHMDELGLSEDKQLMCTAMGFLTSGNSMKRMCDRFIRNGGRIYDVLTAYDSIMAYGLNSDKRGSGESLRTLVPLLKAAGATDSSVHAYFAADMSLMPGSDAIWYLNDLMTSLIVSEAYEHHTMAMCDSLNIPPDIVRCTEVSFDDIDLDRQEGKKFRDIASELSKLDVPRVSSSGGIQFIGGNDRLIMDAVTGLIEKIDGWDLAHQLRTVRPLGGNEKAFALMDMRTRTAVDLDCTAFIGSSGIDYPAMDIVCDNGGLAISFNGDAYAVTGSNVAVMSPNPIVAAYLVSEFYVGGMEEIYDLVGSWGRENITERVNYDRHLTDAMLRAFPSKLPDVVIVDEDNIDSVIKESERYRRKLNV